MQCCTTSASANHALVANEKRPDICNCIKARKTMAIMNNFYQKKTFQRILLNSNTNPTFALIYTAARQSHYTGAFFHLVMK